MYKQLSLLLTLGCIATSATTNNYDLLGRKGSKMNSPMVYRDLDYSSHQKIEKQKIGSSLENKSLAKQGTGLKDGAAAIYGAFTSSYNGTRYYFKNFSENSNNRRIYGSLVDSRIIKLDYFSKANKYFINVNTNTASTQPNYVNAGLIRSGLAGYSFYADYSYLPTEVASPYEYDKQISYTSLELIKHNLGRYGISWFASPKTKWSNVGVYLADDGLPVALSRTNPQAPFILADNATMDQFNPLIGYEMRASRTYNAVKGTSEHSVIYVGKEFAANPSLVNPQIYMGVRSDGGSGVKAYNSEAKKLDNYIYNNRTVELVAAGNYSGKKYEHSNPTGYFARAAHSANAITVGAYDYATNAIAGYSSKTQPEYCSSGNCATAGPSKPDVYNYSNYLMNDKIRYYTSSSGKQTVYGPYYDGTEYSTAFTAGMVSDLLSYNEFFRWHPEVVKARLINSVESSLNNSKVPFYQRFISNMGSINEGSYHSSHYWIGSMDKLKNAVVNGKKEIRLLLHAEDFVNLADIGADGLCATISWLNSGNDIANLGKLPQDFDLYAYESDNSDALLNLYGKEYASSDAEGREYRKKNSHETLCFGTKNTGYFLIRIVLKDEDVRSENYGQIVLGLDVTPLFRK